MAEINADKNVNIGLLILRVGIGLMFVYHGLPKIMGGVEKWTELGQAMGVFGITFMPAFWGFMAAIAEFCGGLSLITGFLTRIFAGLMLITMIVASALMFHLGKGMFGAAYPISMAIVFISLLFTGPGKFILCSKCCCCGCQSEPAKPEPPAAP